MKRRKPAPLAPIELLSFNRADWERPDDGNHFDAFRRWKAARAKWLEQHPGSLGDPLTQLRTEFRTQMSLYDPNATSWSDYER